MLCVAACLFSELSTRTALPGIFSFLQRVPNTMRNAKFAVRGYRPLEQKIAIVDIDNASLEQIGRWPWRRDYIAQLVQEIFAKGARGVGIDILFSDPQVSVPEELQEILKQRNLAGLLAPFDFDRQLGAELGKHRDAVVTAWMSNAVCRPAISAPEECPVFNAEAIASLPEDFSRFALKGVENQEGFPRDRSPLRTAITVAASVPEIASEAHHSGFVNGIFDSDGLVRRVSPLLAVNGEFYPSLAFEMAMLARGERVRVALDGRGAIASIHWEKTGRRIPTARLGHWDINFLGPERHFPYVSARELFVDPQSADGRQIAQDTKAVLDGAWVFLGVSALAVGDLVATPFEPVHPGVEVHATVMENLLSDELLDTGGAATTVLLLLWMLGAGAAIAWIGQKWEAVPALAVSGAVLALSALIDFRGLFYAGFDLNSGFWYLQMIGGLGITVVGRYVMEQKDKKFVRTAFSKYVSPAIVDDILKDPKRLSLGGRRETLTILFSDIRGFTTLAETLDARKLSDFLNDYLGMQTEIIFEHGGTLDKYIGDAVMAFWGAPLGQPDHAERACRAAIAMAAKLEENRARYLEQYGITVNMGIGLHTGEVSVGNMGSARSFSYTVIGDTVNLASRLEGATKYFGAEILTTRTTLEAISHAGGTMPAHRALAEVKVKGKNQVVSVAELLRGEKDPLALGKFQQGLSYYFQRDFKKALACFQAAQKTLGDGSSLRYMELCDRYLREAPPTDWDGTWSLTEK